MPVLNVPKYLVGENVHSKVERTSRRAFLTLEAVLNFLAAVVKNL
jgi:hypothetical protein